MQSPSYLCVPPLVTSEQLGKHVPAATKIYGTREEVLDAVFYARPAACQILSM
jgi:hypothetical protein